MTRTKKFGISAIIIACAVAALVLILRNGRSAPETETFPLSAEIYAEANFQELSTAEFEQLIAEQKSFIVILHMAVCPAEFPIKDVAKQVAQAENLTIYSLKEDDFKQTALAATIKYLPSAAIYRTGELVAFLDAESDEDLEYYKNADGFLKWLRNSGVEL